MRTICNKLFRDPEVRYDSNSRVKTAPQKNEPSKRIVGAVLTSKGRKRIKPGNFALPKERRYPIHDLSHARNALARASGKPEEAKVRAAVYRKYPELKKKAKLADEPTIERFRISPLVIRLTEGDDGVKVPHRIQLFRTGTFKKLMPDGQTLEFSITREVLSEIEKNWRDNVRGVAIALDFAHRSDEEAAGWITNLVVEDEGHESQLWAEIDWTPDGRAAVAGKKFRYVSPDFAFAWTDNETGEKYGATLFGAGLTNRPVIKNMAPTVELTEVKDMKKTTTKKGTTYSELTVEELKLKLAEEKDEDKKALLQSFIDSRITLEEMSEDDESDDGEDDDGDEDDAPKGKKKKSADEMNLEELKAAYTKQCEEMADMKKQMAKSLSEVAAITTAAAKKEKEATFAKLMAEGKLVPAQKEAFMAGDAIKLAELAQPVKFGAVGREGGPVKTDGASASDKVIKLADELCKKEKLSRGDAISQVLSENPELSEAYLKEMEGTENAGAAH